MSHPWDDAPRTAFARWSPTAAQEQYRTTGLACIPRFMGQDAADALAERMIDSATCGPPFRRVVSESRPASPDSDGRRHAAYLAAGHDATQAFPELVGLYHAARLITEAVTCRPVILSPYQSSGVTVKVYGPLDEQEWHRDSNPVAALLVLRGDGPQFKGDRCTVRCEAGTLLVFAGRARWHRVPPMGPEEWKVAVPFNLYHPEDTWRPAGQDERVYG